MPRRVPSQREMAAQQVRLALNRVRRLVRGIERACTRAGSERIEELVAAYRAPFPYRVLVSPDRSDARPGVI